MEWLALNESADHVKCPYGLVKRKDVTTVSDHDLLEVEDFSGVTSNLLSNLPDVAINSPIHLKIH